MMPSANLSSHEPVKCHHEDRHLRIVVTLFGLLEDPFDDRFMPVACQRTIEIFANPSLHRGPMIASPFVGKTGQSLGIVERKESVDESFVAG